jgi:hypothetical protein
MPKEGIPPRRLGGGPPEKAKIIRVLIENFLSIHEMSQEAIF